MKKMLEKEVGSDMVIIPGTGNPVKAHKCQLMVRSPVFQAMFETNMQEASTTTVEVSEMSEEGVRALLAFLYHSDQSAPDEKCAVALELLCAGQKYTIPVLEAAIRDLILGKEDNWMDAEVAVQVFLFARNMPEEVDGNELKKKAAKALKA